MIITKIQSKQLRYLCGAAECNQPCTRKYTGGPEGKIREIGKFKYIERDGELIRFEFEGQPVKLSLYSIKELLAVLDGGTVKDLVMEAPIVDEPPLDVLHYPRELIKNEAECLETLAPSYENCPQKESVKSVEAEPVKVDVFAPQTNNIHPINVPVQIECIPEKLPEGADKEIRKNIAKETGTPAELSDGVTDGEAPQEKAEVFRRAAAAWMDADGNDPEGLDAGSADAPVYAEELPHEIDTSTEVPPVLPVSEKPILKEESPMIDNWGEALRETAMTAAAREAAINCGIDGIPDKDTSVDIVRACYTVPGFMDKYSEYLRKAGTPRSLEEIAVALPAQRQWVFGQREMGK